MSIVDWFQKLNSGQLFAVLGIFGSIIGLILTLWYQEPPDNDQSRD